MSLSMMQVRLQILVAWRGGSKDKGNKKNKNGTEDLFLLFKPQKVLLKKIYR